MSQLVDAPATQKHVMIKVRMLPTAASTLLRAVKQGETMCKLQQPAVEAVPGWDRQGTKQTNLSLQLCPPDP